MHTNRLLALGLASVVTLGSVAACAAPDVPAEGHGSTTAALLKPKPTLKAAASKETTAKYGITEWRMYKKKSGVVLTGYDADGKAVKGVTTGFADSKDTGNPEVVTHLNDGSHATLKRSLVAEDSAVDADVPADSVQFAKQVAGDLGGLQQSLTSKATLASIPDAVASCGQTLADLCAAAIQCCCGFLFGGWGGGDALQGAWGAASAAIQSGTQCAYDAVGVAVEISSNVSNVDVGVNANASAQNLTANPLANGSARQLLADGDKLDVNPDTGDVDFALDDN